MPPVHLYAPVYICMSPYTSMLPMCHGDSGGICSPHMSWGLLGQHLYITTSVRHFCVCQYIHLLLSSQWSYPLLPIIVGCFSNGLDAYGYILSFLLLTCSFLCSVFIMSHASASKVMTTTPPLTDVYSGTSSLLTTITMDPSLMGFLATSGSMMWFCNHH